MKRLVGYLVATVGVSALAAVPVVNARMGGGGAPIQQGSAGHWRSFDGGGRFDRDRFHNRSSFFFFGAFPFWYPYYWPPDYYYYDYPPPYYYYGDYNYAPRYYYDSGPPVSYYNDRNTSYPAYDGRSYLMLGHDAGKGLRKKTVTWDWFVEYLKAYIVNAPPWARDDFQRGFVAGYGDNAESMYKKGIQQVGQRNVSSTESPLSPEPNPNSQRY
jgi:hypothetical protein